MTFLRSRITIFVITSVAVIWLIFKSKKSVQMSKRMKISLLLLYVLVFGTILKLPLEKSLVVWDSPEKAFNYMYTNEPIFEFQGDNSYFILYLQPNTRPEATVLKRVDNGFKFDDEHLNNHYYGYLGNAGVTIYNYANTDYYIVVNGFINVNTAISDSCSSKITRCYIETKEDIKYPNNNIPSIFCGHIEDFSDDYYIIINGIRYDINLEDAVL